VGPIYSGDSNNHVGDGVYIQADTSNTGRIFTAQLDNSDRRLVFIGHSDLHPVAQFNAWAGQVLIQGSSDDGGNGLVNLLADGNANITAYGEVRLTSYNDGVYIKHDTSSDSANCVIGIDGLIARGASSLRYKQDVEDLTIDADKVLQLRPRTWRDKNAVAADPETDRRHVGFIAEELDQLGLTEFVTYDDQGPEAIKYDRLTAALIPVLQQQQQQINALSARLDALEAQ
jgi:hypothetical protein